MAMSREELQQLREDLMREAEAMEAADRKGREPLAEIRSQIDALRARIKATGREVPLPLAKD